MATRWTVFAGGTLLVLALVLWLARASARLLADSDSRNTAPVDPPSDEASPAAHRSRAPGPGSNPFGSKTALFANVAVSQLVLVVVMAGLVWYAGVPRDALGLEAIQPGLLPGVALGGGLYVLGETGVALLERAEIDVDDTLRELLAPASPLEWVLLLAVVLPLVAVGEELLFRAALIGAVSVGFSVSPWPLVVLSAIVFGLGHGVQGRGGVVVTGGLGLALGAAFVLTNDLSVVIAAHYVVNALEFLGPAADVDGRLT